jgi:hypothetical protein
VPTGNTSKKVIFNLLSLLQKDGLVIPGAVIGNQAFEKSKSSGFPLSRE